VGRWGIEKLSIPPPWNIPISCTRLRNWSWAEEGPRQPLPTPGGRWNCDAVGGVNLCRRRQNVPPAGPNCLTRPHARNPHFTGIRNDGNDLPVIPPRTLARVWLYAWRARVGG